MFYAFYIVSQKIIYLLIPREYLHGKPYRNSNDFEKSIHSLKNTRTYVVGAQL